MNFLDDIQVYYHPVPNFPNYFISRFGEVWSRNKGKKLTPKRCGKNSQYRRIQLFKNGKYQNKLIHRLVLEAFIGPCPEGMEACHNNGDSTDNRLENLRWDTHSNNMLDSVDHGTLVDNSGESNGMSKLTLMQVRIVKNLLSFSKLTLSEVAEVFNVGISTIVDIKAGRTW